jgi:hypothetical protein
MLVGFFDPSFLGGLFPAQEHSLLARGEPIDND